MSPLEHPTRITVLDGLRGYAALLVLWGHFPFVEGLLPVKHMSYVVGSGYLGVDIFFVLSGFLITRILLREKQEGRLSFRTFYLKRALRIFPIYYLTLLIVGCAITWKAIGWLALYLGNYYFALDLHAHPLRHTWSLSVEEHFYLFWPLLLYLLPRARARKVILFWLPALAIASAFVAANTLGITVADSLIYRGTNFRMLSLCIGSALAFHEGWARALRPWILVVLLLAIVPVAVLAAHMDSTAFGPIIISNFTWKLVLYALASLCSLLVALGFSSAGHMPARITLSVISNPVTRFFGRISYGLYLYHYPILFSLGLLDDTTVISKSEAIMLAGVLVAVPTLSWYVIEAPLLRWKDRLTAR